MKKREQQLADELDAILTAALRGEQSADVDEALQAETQAAAELMKLAAAQEPDPAFVDALEKRLAEKAAVSSRRQKRVMERPERLSFWQKVQQLVKDEFAMKRITYGLGAVAALAAVIVIGLFVLRGGPANDLEPGAAVAEVTPEPGDPAVDPATDSPAEEGIETPVAVADLPALPALDSTMGTAQGLGGGGAAVSEAADAPRPQGGGGVGPGAMILPFTDIFSGTEFVLNTTLPTDVGEALVQRQEPLEMDEARAQEMANLFGFDGPLYRTYQRPFLAPEGAPQEAFEMPVVYFAFDGNRTLNIDSYGVYYSDNSVQFDFENPLPFDEAAAIAETFLQERNLLTFPYEVSKGWGPEVVFKRLIDGRPLNQPEITVTVTSDGQIAFVGYSVLSRLETLGTYPLRTAEEAWALIQGGVAENDILFNWLPQTEDAQPVIMEEPMMEDEFRFWQREYQPGEEIYFYGWPSIYLPVNEGGLPRIEMYPYVLDGTAEQLQAIVDTDDSMLYVHGTLGEDGRTLSIIDWEVRTNQEPLFLEGVVRREGDQVQLLTNERDIYVLPNAPADVEDGLNVFVFAWDARDIGASALALDWQNIEVRMERAPDEEMLPVEPLPEPLPIEEPGFVNPTLAQVTIDSVSLGFYHMPIFPEMEAEGNAAETSIMRGPVGPPTIILMPVWQFEGSTSDGGRLQLVVNAVMPEFLETAE